MAYMAVGGYLILAFMTGVQNWDSPRVAWGIRPFVSSFLKALLRVSSGQVQGSSGCAHAKPPTAHVQRPNRKSLVFVLGCKYCCISTVEAYHQEVDLSLFGMGRSVLPLP